MSLSASLPAAQAARYVGVEVAKVSVEVAIRPTGEHWQSTTDEAVVGSMGGDGDCKLAFDGEDTVVLKREGMAWASAVAVSSAVVPSAGPEAFSAVSAWSGSLGLVEASGAADVLRAQSQSGLRAC